MPREALLVRSLVELADNLVDDFDVVDLLTLLSHRCVEVLDVSAAGVMLAAPTGGLQVVASSSEAMRTLELFELQADEGPCVECYATGTAIVNLELSLAGRRWPRFAARATDDGFRTVHALPMRLRHRSIGALNLFRSEGGVLGPDDVGIAQALADVATIAILQHQAAVDARMVNEQLNQALNSRIAIEQAKGKISEASNIDISQAFSRLRNHARNHNVRLADLAADVASGRIDPRSLDVLPPDRRS
jgi:GAF domain-containing protein